jgi:hypothetical protein
MRVVDLQRRQMKMWLCADLYPPYWVLVSSHEQAKSKKHPAKITQQKAPSKKHPAPSPAPSTQQKISQQTAKSTKQLVTLQATPAVIAARALPWLMAPLLQLVALQATPPMIAARTLLLLTAPLR